MRKIIIIFFTLLLADVAVSQEFLVDVQIQSQQIQGVDPSVFDEMQKSITDFMINRKWTNINFQLEERIRCTMVFTFNKAVQGGDKFAGQLNVVLQRPVYGTDYNSVLINIVDKDIEIAYTPYQTMNYADNTFTDNLTSILAYYAYLMLGIEMDSYSQYEGTPFYEKALAVTQSAQSANEKGLQAIEGPKNRYHLVENLLNSSYQPIRTFLYTYHRKGLDVMADNMDQGRQAVTASLDNLKKVFDKRPSLYLLQVILQAKRQEIINIYSEATPTEKVAMVNVMKEVDPPYGSRYDEVMK